MHLFIPRWPLCLTTNTKTTSWPHSPCIVWLYLMTKMSAMLNSFLTYLAGSSELLPNLDSRIKKTECLYQPTQNLNPVPGPTSNHNSVITITESKGPGAVFWLQMPRKHLSPTMLAKTVSPNIAQWEMQVSWKTRTGYGKSSMCLLKALFKVYLAVVFFSLLYAAETWTIYHTYSKELSSMLIWWYEGI